MSKLYQCFTCQYTTTRKQNYERHLLSPLHINGKKKYECEKCNVSFKQKGHLITHYKSNTHKGICPVVDKRKLKQTHGYLKKYNYAINIKKKKLKIIINRDMNIQGDEKTYDELEVGIDKLEPKRDRMKLKYEQMFNLAMIEFLTPYFNPTWRAIAMWFYNTQ